SRKLHVSADMFVPAVAEHDVDMPSALQIVVPNRVHTPWPAEHVVPSVVNVSSVFVSQSSSIWLHSSVVGAPAVTEHSTPVPALSQRMLPKRWHAPTPGLHRLPTPGNVSSVLLSQSSSALLQASTVGIWPSHTKPPAPAHVRVPVHEPM